MFWNMPEYCKKPFSSPSLTFGEFITQIIIVHPVSGFNLDTPYNGVATYCYYIARTTLMRVCSFKSRVFFSRRNITRG